MNLTVWFPEYPFRFPLALLVSFSKLQRRAPSHAVPRRSPDEIEALAIGRLGALSASPSHLGVGRMVHRLASLAGSGPDQASLLQAIMPVCNIGRLAVPDAILNRAGPLDAAERRIMEADARIGARLLAGSASPLVALAAEVALCQHERWDGSGYPAGLAGQQIPRVARIVASADSFEACLSNSSRGPGWLLGRAVEHMRQEAGTRFDPMLTRLFLEDLPAMLLLRESPVGLQPRHPDDGFGRNGRLSGPPSQAPGRAPTLPRLARRMTGLAQRVRLGLRAAWRPA